MNQARPRLTPFLFVGVLVAAGCEAPQTELTPDAQLQRELGLAPDDRVHTVSISTGVSERAEPDSIVVFPGDYLQFVSDDWLVHEVRFQVDDLGADAASFLEATGQSASPPLLQLGARFLLVFEGAPAGRYPYTLEGNRASGTGLIVVASPPGLP